ncbi:MAG: InlB B-repeat-containing protein [Ignavibacteriales bacterium]|nr:InlB B-repeat-containing protein [Ignavibacteriales bacterium]
MSVAAGYSINDVLVDGNSVGPVSSYTFTNISADHTISVSARASAGGITSTTTGGNWGSSATWVGGVVPGAGDTVTIAAGATVTVNGSFESKTLTLNNSATAGSTVNITAGNALNVGNGSGAVAIGLNLATITTTTTTSLTVSGSFSSGTVSMIARRVGNRNTDVSLATNSANASITIDGNIMQDRNVTTGGLTNDVSLAAGGSLNLSGNFVQVTSGGTFTIGTTTTIDYSGSGAQTIPAGTYFNLTLGGSGTKTTTGVTVNGTLSMQGTATATTAPTYGAGAVLEYKSTSAQTTSAEFLATLANVVIDNASGVTLDASKTVTGTLTLTSGYISTGANTLTASGTVSRTNGHIVGNFAKPVTTGSPSVTFEVGDANTYSPAQVSFGTVSTAGTLTAKATGGDHPNLSTSNINSFRSLNRYWTIANTGVVFDAANLVYNFTSSDVDANSVANDFIIAKYDSPNWTYPTKGTQSATSIEATGITSFSDFAFGQLLATYTIVATAGENGSVSPADTSVVNEGSSPTFTFTPSTGYHVDSIFVDGTAQAGADSYTFNNVSANHTLHGTFAINSYTLTVNAENGTVAVNPDQSTYTHGTSVELTATSDTGYHFVNWSGGLTGSENPDTVVMDGNKTVTANFAIDTFTISASADGNGTISPSGDVTVNYGSAQQFTFSGNTGYHADSVFVDDVFVDSTAGYTFSNVTANHTIHVTFALNMYSLTANAENGTVTKNPSAASYAHGSSVELTATSDSAYVFTNWSGDLTGSQNPDTLLMDGDKTVTANFVLNTRTITATAGANGSISPSGAVTVDYAGSQRFTFAANEGFALDTLYVDGSVVDSISGYTFTNVTDDHTIHVVFTNLYTISASAGSNGSINPSGSVMVLNGRSQTFTFAANTGYHLDSLVVDGVGSTSESGSYTFSNVTENHSINVTFAINTYTLSASAGENGTITPSGDMTVNYGSNQRYVFSANTGYHVDSLFVDDSFVDSTAGYTFSNITSSHTIHVTFALNGYTLTVNATNGTVAKNPDQSTYTHGTNVELTASPSTGYHFTDWSGDVTGSQNPDTLLMDGNKTVTANFTINVYTINASAGSNATISPSGDVSINYGNNQTFTMSAAEGYTIDDVLVDGNSVGPVATYTFSAVDSNHTISVSARVSTGVTSTATGGNWSSGATWVGGSVPGSGDSVMIAPGATVTVDGNFAAKTLTVGNSAGVGSSLVINSGNSLNVGNGSGSVNVGVEQSTVTTTNTTSLTVGGTLTSGTITMTARRLNNKNTDISFSTNSANAIITVQGDIVQDRNATVGNASNDITFASGGTLNLTGDFVQVGTGGTFTNGTTTTFNYNGTGTQTVLAGTYFNLTLGGSGDKTTTGVTVNGTLSMQGTATASAVPTYGGSAVLEYKGSASQTTGVEFPASFGNVVINNSNGVTLGASKSITGTLTLTSGNVSTGSNTLALTSTGTISRTPGSGHVVGNLQKNVATGASIRTFEIGDDDEYTPVTVSFGNVTVAGNLTAKSTGTEHPNLSSSTLNVLRSLNRYWTITNAGITFNSAGIVFNYVSADVDANTNANNFSVGKYDSPNWTYPTKGTQTATSIQATGITSFSDFTFAEQLVNYTIIASAGSNGTISPSDTLVLAEGADQTFTITANATYHLDSLFVDGTSVPTTSEYTFTNITSNHTIHATFAINMYSLTVNAENGTVSTNPEQASYAHGTSVELTASSATGYHFANWSDDLTGSENPDTLIMNGDKTVTANFEINTYTLTVNAENGTVSKNPEQDTYNHGSSVELTATSATGYYFANWSGDLSGSENPDTLVMNGDKTVTANFEINTYTLTVNATNGTVSKNPNQESYTHGSSVELTASPATGYHFANWSDDLSGSENPDTLLMDGDKTVTVNFEINTFTITATADENGSIAPSGDVTVNYSDNQQFTFSGNTGYHVDSIFVDDAFVDSSESYTFVNVTENHTIHATFAINMYSLTVNAENGTVTTSPMMESYAHGTMVELTAAASEGYHFAYWSNDLGGSENPDTLEMTSDKTVTANFEINSYTITASADDNGSIFPSGEVSVNYGDDMQFTFAADEGYHFDSLFVDDAFVDSSESFTFMNVSSDHSIYATFAINMYSLTVNAENGTVAKNPNQESYAHGSEVELTATAATGYAFVNWSGDASGSDNPLMITMAGNTTITANFSSNTFTLTVSAENGSVAINPDQTNYVSGTEVTLTASANTGYHFTNWSGDASGSTNPLTIVMDGDKEIFAHFSINTYSLTINAENGSVSANPSENEYEHGSMVELTATAENGYHFVDWSGDLTGTENPDTLLMNEDKTVTANFAINMYSLTITAENGTVTKNPSQELYAHGTSVELTATPSEGYAFTFWSGDASGSDNPTSVTMDDDKSVTANFAMNTFTLTVTSENGNVTVDPDQASYEQGTSVQLTATPFTGYHFVNWSGDLSGNENPDTLVIDSDKSVTANFALDSFTITASAGDNGSITPSGEITVMYGDDTTFTISANENYAIADVLVDGNSVGAVSSYTFENVSENHTIAASFAFGTYTITATAGENGTIEPSGEVEVTYGNDQTFAITPSEGYQVDDVLVDNNSVGAVGSYTFENVNADHSIAASFAIAEFIIMASAGENGTISPSGEVSVNYGSDIEFTITADTGYHISSVMVDNESVGDVSSYTFFNVTADHSIHASFSIDMFTIFANAGENGIIEPAGEVMVNYGADQSFAISANEGYHIYNVLVDNDSVGPLTQYTFTNVMENHSISASFEINEYTITASAGDNGSIVPPGAIVVDYGTDIAFKMLPNEGYHVDSIVVDNEYAGDSSTYMFMHVSSNHTIHATFAINVYYILATAGQNGTITPSGQVQVNYGATQAFTITPDVNYQHDSVIVDGVRIDSTKSYTFRNIATNHNIRATFKLMTYTILATSGQNGTISPSGQVQVIHGANQTFRMTPNVGYVVDSVVVDGGFVGRDTTYTFTEVTANHSISVKFRIMTYTILATPGQNGAIAPSGQVQVNHGANQTFRMIPNNGFIVDSIIVDGSFVGRDTTFTFQNVTANHTIRVAFRLTPPGQVILVSPAHGAVIPADSVRLVWRMARPNVTKYYILGALDSLFTNARLDSTTDTSFIVRGLPDNVTFWWKVRARNGSGIGQFSEARKFRVDIPGGVNDGQGLPTEFAMAQNYPNPFNPTTNIKFGLPKEATVTLTIFNALGQEVATLVNEVKQSGWHEVTWNSNEVSTGMYIYRITAVATSNSKEVFTSTRKMILAK